MIVVGEEEFLIDRAVRNLITAAGTRARPGTSTASTPRAGPRERTRSPRRRCRRRPRGGDQGRAERVQGRRRELAQYPASPAPDAALIMTDAGGARGKDLMAARRAGAQAIERPKVTRFADRLDFVAAVPRGGQRADDPPPGPWWTPSAGTCASSRPRSPPRTDRRSMRPWWPPTTGAAPRRRLQRGRPAVEGIWPSSSRAGCGHRCLARADLERLGQGSGCGRSAPVAAPNAAPGPMGAPRRGKIDRVRQQLRGWYASRTAVRWTPWPKPTRRRSRAG